MSVDYQATYHADLSILKCEAMESASPGRAGRDGASTERPLVVVRGDRRVLFGPGVDDFNEFDDPC